MWAQSNPRSEFLALPCIAPFLRAHPGHSPHLAAASRALSTQLPPPCPDSISGSVVCAFSLERKKRSEKSQTRKKSCLRKNKGADRPGTLLMPAQHTSRTTYIRTYIHTYTLSTAEKSKKDKDWSGTSDEIPNPSNHHSSTVIIPLFYSSQKFPPLVRHRITSRGVLLLLGHTT